MKLKASDWKHAWFESHISERFFQEMSRLEKGTVQGLVSTAQWTEQIMIEVGALAQAMIRLEQDGPSEPQIRQACDKAQRLAALGLHLITALDGADREQMRSASIVTGSAGQRAGVAPAAMPNVAPDVQNPTAIAKPAAAPKARNAIDPAALALNRGAGHRPPLAPPKSNGSPSASEPEPQSPDTEAATPMFSSLVQVSGRDTPRSESHMRETIISLGKQGLSRAEIEMVTGEPRHIIEAVLNHARMQQQAARQG